MDSDGPRPISHVCWGLKSTSSSEKCNYQEPARSGLGIPHSGGAAGSERCRAELVCPNKLIVLECFETCACASRLMYVLLVGPVTRGGLDTIGMVHSGCMSVITVPCWFEVFLVFNFVCAYPLCGRRSVGLEEADEKA